MSTTTAPTTPAPLNTGSKKASGLRLFNRKNRKIFGVPLDEAIKKSTINHGLPLVLTRCADYLERKAIKQEGVYRRSGNQKTVEDLMKLYDAGKDPNLDDYDPYVIAGLLKRYFTLLPDPITSYDLYDKFISAQMLKNRAMRPRAMKLLVDELPKNNQYVLYFVVQHLVNVAQHNEENKMGVSNLAIVFGPTLFRSRDESPVRLLSDVAFLRGCVETFIKDYDIVFSSIIPENERVPVNPQRMSDAANEDASDLMGTSASMGIDSYLSSMNGSSTSRETSDRRARNRDNRNVQLHGNLEELDEDSVIKKQRGVSMSNMEYLKEERSHLRFLLDKIAEDTEREELEMGITRKDIKRDLESNMTRFDELNEHERMTEEREMLTSPALVDPDLPRKLAAIELDVNQPFESINARVNLRMKSVFLQPGKNTSEMTIEELSEEKTILKKELRFFDDAYKNQNGVEPDKARKEPLRKLYNRYKEVRVAISNRQSQEKSALSSSSITRHSTSSFNNNNGSATINSGNEEVSISLSINDENYISPNSPLYGLKKETMNKVSGGSRASHRMSLCATMPARLSASLNARPLTGSVENPESVGLTNNAEALRMLLEDNTFVELRKEKKHIQRTLHQFQNEFQKQHGRKVTTKADRQPLEAEYKRYKEVKGLISQMILDAESQCSS